MKVQELVEFLCDRIKSIKVDRPILVAIDGVDACGKTTLSKQVIKGLEDKSYPVIGASIDEFHNPREERYRLGSKSAEGYYRNSFNYRELIKYLLHPLKENKDMMYKTAVYDFKTESEINQNYKTADRNCILVMEGVFLLRPELYEYWDCKIFLHVDFEEVIRRTQTRDQHLFGSAEEIENRYRSKYIPGQQIYLAEAEPYIKSDIIINNNDYNNPFIVESKDEIEILRERVMNF